MPSSCATTCATLVLRPWPISVPPWLTSTEPSPYTCTSAPAWLRWTRLNEMPNFTGVSARPRLSTSLLALKAAISSRARAVAAGRLELGDELVDDVVVDALAVGRDVALAVPPHSARPVEVDAAHVERVLAELARDRCRGCSRSRSRPAARRSRETRCCSACWSCPNSRGWRRRAASRRCRSGRPRASSPGPTDRPRSRRARPSSARRRGRGRRRRSPPRTRSGSSGAGR